MSSQKRTGLTAGDLESLSAALAAGKRVTVYLRDPMPSLGLDAGTSARVLSIEGSTVTVRPKGVDDQLPFESDELQRTRSAAAPAKSAPRSAKTVADQTSTPARPAPTPKAAAVEPKPTPEPAPRPEATPARAAAPKPAPAKAARRSKTSTAAVSVTITSAGESTWTVSVAHGSKKGKPTEVTADRVARAMQELGDDAAITAVDEVIESAREAAQRKIEELTRELENARAALAHLDVGPAES
ncbi:hypothetical protein GONAM_02_01430 [Gordonia namibiensis NBRC 108229]|uniref:Translation initiation factor n=1 Tax=Gordonia namibiensis NBRC 108229 TaxID=1208314 RepID=K6WH22_9ACTN|nr:DUF6319 family protein [Gordonia namibiensis]GAB98620.1 hypothetical protein GONAM_02_01430 [Gordonia namibiensis NBRC 108229]